MDLSAQCRGRCHRSGRPRRPGHPLLLRHPRAIAVDPLSGQQSASLGLEQPWPVDRGNAARRWRAAFFLRCAGATDHNRRRTRCRHSATLGRRWPTAPDDVSYRQHPCLQLRRLRSGHRRAR
ncbi:hypothetical protein M9827_05110 [Pseudomonas sp. AKS31]|nr:hypothetical protein [Pseudomonas sp. AKS31]